MEETGYAALKRLFYKVKSFTGQTPLLMDAQDVCAAPEEYIRYYCEYTGVPFYESALRWKAGGAADHAVWEEFHADVHRSESIKPLPPPPAIETLPPYVQEMAEKVMPIYEELSAYKIKPAE